MAINYHHLDNVVQEVGNSNSIDHVIIFFTIFIQEWRCFFLPFLQFFWLKCVLIQTFFIILSVCALPIPSNFLFVLHCNILHRSCCLCIGSSFKLSLYIIVVSFICSWCLHILFAIPSSFLLMFHCNILHHSYCLHICSSFMIFFIKLLHRLLHQSWTCLLHCICSLCYCLKLLSLQAFWTFVFWYSCKKFIQHEAIIGCFHGHFHSSHSTGSQVSPSMPRNWFNLRMSISIFFSKG